LKFNKQAGTWAIIYCPSAGTFLFGRRSDMVNKPGVWNFFGGHIDEGETPRQALVRELHEEAGIARSDGDLVHFGGVSDADIQGLGYVEALRELHYFLLLADHEFTPRLNHEHSEFRWFKPHSLPRNLNRPSAIAINIGLIQKAQQFA
jgi:8-oxo-dGTP diphosphatase